MYHHMAQIESDFGLYDVGKYDGQVQEEG